MQNWYICCRSRRNRIGQNYINIYIYVCMYTTRICVYIYGLHRRDYRLYMAYIYIQFWSTLLRNSGITNLALRTRHVTMLRSTAPLQTRRLLWAVSCDLWAVTCDLWSVICDLWSVICDLWSVMCELNSAGQRVRMWKCLQDRCTTHLKFGIARNKPFEIPQTIAHTLKKTHAPAVCCGQVYQWCAEDVLLDFCAGCDQGPVREDHHQYALDQGGWWVGNITHMRLTKVVGGGRKAA